MWSNRPRSSILYWVYVWLPVAVGIGIIALESTVWFGADRPSGPLRRIFEALFGHVSNARWEIIHH